ECCGHLSAFTIDGVSYEMDTGGIDGMWSDMFGGAPPQSMEVRLDRVLQPGMEFFHEYDFGSTTYLKLRVADQWEGLLPQDELKVLARNHPPPIACNVCGALATEVCTDCMWGGNGWVCEAHAEEHECGMEMMLPVVNSPRVGVCGYTG
ncbi:MAG: hypothetical protein HY784_01865, partial [Chloroflexi bacterium]|nr:hypothetical protein [Chloroflexota bacterium]